MRHTKISSTVISLFLVLLLLLCCTGCTKNGETVTSEDSTERTEDAQSNDKLTAQKVIETLQASAESYGFENALTGLDLHSETSIDGDTYYRFQQNYHGIPVYGRSVVCLHDASGQTITVGNLLDVDSDLDLSQSLSDEQISVACADYFASQGADSDYAGTIIPTISEKTQCVYNLFGHEACLAYNVVLAVNGTSYNMLVACPSSEILICNPCLVTDDSKIVIGSGEDVDGKTVSFSTYKRDASSPYILYDEQRNLIVYDAAGETVFTDYSFIANDGEKYHSQTRIDALSNTEYTLFIRESDNVAVDTALLRFDPATLEWFLSKKESGTGLEVPTSTSTVWTDKNQVTAINRAEIIYDFYQSILQRNGFDGNGSRMHIVINNKGAKSGTAFSLTPYKHTAMTMISFYKVMSLDVMAHEYTHSVEGSESGMIYQNESGAIMEALSDIFGELVEDFADDQRMNRSCDWIHGSRDISDPFSSGNPKAYHETCWLPTYTDKNDIEKEGNDRGHVHNNSTVISHAAYLMSQGIDGTASKSIPTDQLAKLWYRAMLMMPSDCSFATCRRLVVLAAQSINLSSDQIACIGEAFDAAGIYAETRDFDFIVGPGSTLTVLDKNGNPYADYVCHINGTLSRRTELEDRSYTQSFLDNTEAPLPLPLQEGSYAIRLYDKTDAPQPINFTLKIDPAKAAEEIKIGTNYQAAADSPSFTAEDLLDGYWENNIQCPQVYQFKSDGTVDVYYPNVRSTIVRPDELEYSRSMHYEYDGKVLAFTGENGSRTELELVTIDDTIAFDEGLALDAIPSGVPFFYETGWVHDPNADSDNALYLVKVDEFRIVTDPNSIYDGDSITLAGTLTDETVQTDLWGAEKAYVLVLDEPIEKNLYYDAGGFLGERVTLDRVLVGFNYRESYLRSEFLGKHITINGTAAYPDRDQYISPFLVTYALAEISEDPSHNSPTNDNPDIYTTFLQDQLYADYYYDKIQIWDDDSRNIQIRYAIYDINADGIQELLIYRWEMEFGDLMVFTQDSSGHVAYAGTLGMYLSPSYSPANNSLVYLYMRPSANGSPWDKDYDYEFVQLRGQSLVSLGHAIYNSGKEKWTSVDSGISVNEETDGEITFMELP